MLAKLQFLDYFVTDIEYKFNPMFTSSDDEKLSPEFGYEIKMNEEDPTEALVYLSISIGEKNLKENSVYVSVTIVGHFKAFNVEDQEELEYYFTHNTLAILYPYLRSLVSEITSKGSEAPIILPTLNIVSLIHEMKSQKEEVK